MKFFESGDGKNTKKVAVAAVTATVAVGAVGVFAFTAINAKDPKEVVTDAFQTAFSSEQPSPAEEIFGFGQLAEAAETSSTESGITLGLDDISEESLSFLNGSGLRLAARNDTENGASDFSMGAVYNGMDVVDLDLYYGNETLMLAVPQLSEKVLSLDLGEGLEERVKNSPSISRLMEENGINPDAFAASLDDFGSLLSESAESGNAMDFEALMKRYREGCKAQENFKTALTVEKTDKKTFSVGGKDEACRGYTVLVSKASLIDFLKTSSDFFLQDETLKEQYLNDLRLSVRLTALLNEIAGTEDGSASITPEQLQADAYAEAKEAADLLIAELDSSLSDIHMTVYVTRDGKLAAFNGSTALTSDDGSGQASSRNVAFQADFGNSASSFRDSKWQITLGTGGDSMTLNLVEKGVYDEKQLTYDVSMEILAGADAESIVFLTGTGTYTVDGGDYHASLEAGSGGVQIFKISASGVVTQLEKGKTVEADIDSLEFSTADSSLIFSGDCYFRPLSGEIAPPEGAALDVLAATEDDWYALIEECTYGFLKILSQLGAPL